MNIFYLDADPSECAKFHFNKHIIKMLTEYIQILCTNIHLLFPNIVKKLLDSKTIELFKPTHKNHPSVIWARSSVENFKWLLQLAIECGKEHEFRYSPKKSHRSLEKVKYINLFIPFLDKVIKENDFFEPPQAMPEVYKNPSSLKAYHNYYNSDLKSHLVFFKKRAIPYFIKVNKLN